MALLLPFTISRYSQNTLTGPPVTDYVAWLNASDLVVNGTNVSNWKDEKNAWNIGAWSTIAATYNPSYRNNYAGISLNSTNPNPNQTVPTSSGRIDFRTSNSLTIMNAWIVDNTSSCRTLAGISTDGTTNNFLLWGQGMNAGTLPGTTVWLRTGNGSDVLTSGANVTLTVGALIVYTVTFTQTSSTTSTVTFSVNNAGTVTGNSTQFSSNVFYLTPVSEGYYSPASFNPNRSTNSTLLETIAWNRILNSTEQSNVYNYLVAKYSIPTLSVSSTTATVTLPVAYSGISVTLFQNTIATTSGGTVYGIGYTSGTTVTFSVVTGYFYYASINGSTSYTNIVGAVSGPAAPLTDMTAWLNAGLGVITSGGYITTWYDAKAFLNISGWSSYSVTSNSSYINGLPAIITPSTSVTIPSGAAKPASQASFNWRGTSNLTYVSVSVITNASGFNDSTDISSGTNNYNCALDLYSSKSATGLGVQFGTVAANITTPTLVVGSVSVLIASYSYDGTTVTEKVTYNNGSVTTATSTNANDLLTSNVYLYPVSQPSITNGGNYPSGASYGVAILDKMLWTRLLSASEQSSLFYYFFVKYLTVVSLQASTYSGSGTWFDSSSNGKNATLENGTAAKNAGGNGIVLNGSTNWTFSNVATGNTWSFSVWYKNTGAQVGTGDACVLTQTFTSSINLALGYLSNSTTFTSGFFNGAWRLGTNITLSNAWTHFGATWDGTTLSTYINGSLLGSTTPGGSSPDNGTSYRIGRRWDLADYMVGEIGEVSITKSVLTASFISGLYSATRGIYGV